MNLTLYSLTERYPKTNHPVLVYRQEFQEWIVTRYLGDHQWKPCPYPIPHDSISFWCELPLSLIPDNHF